MKLLYLPFKIIAGMVGAKLGQRVFNQLWSKIDEDDPPEPAAVDAKWSKIVGAAVIKAAALAGVAAIVDKGTAKAFQSLTGYWPGDERSEGSDAQTED